MNDFDRVAAGHSLEDTPLTVTDQELLAARLTAYALGDLGAAEAAEVDRLLADPARVDERRQVEEVRLVAAALEAGSSEAEGSRSADLRRAVVAAATAARPTSTADSPDTSSPPIAGAPRRAAWGMLVTLGGLAAAVLVAATLFVAPRAERRVAVRVPAPRVDEALARESAAKPLDRAAPIPPAPAAAASPEQARVPAQRAVRDSADKQRKADRGGSAMTAGRAKAAEDRFGAAALAAKETHAALSGDRRASSAPSPMEQALEKSERDGTGLHPRGEGYAAVVESRPCSPREQPLSTFSIDVDTASYANVRRFLVGGRLPPRDSVRIEELLNYFSYAYPQPQGEVPFSVTVDAAECPWKTGHRLVRIGLQGRDIDRAARPAGNLVFLLDVSG